MNSACLLAFSVVLQAMWMNPATLVF